MGRLTAQEVSMRTPAVTAVTLATVAALAIAGCGGSSNGGASANEGGSAAVLMGTAPDYLDPQLGYTTQSSEATWISYTPLLTYRHAGGEQGTELIPGLAEDLPTVSSDGRTYTLRLRKSLVFSDGKPVKASDFEYTIERAIKLNWGGKSFFTTCTASASTRPSRSASSTSRPSS
jgi:peptide/nickel transport system substrate-binding protein